MKTTPLKKLLAGGYGLSKTFWLFGMLTFMMLNIFVITAVSYGLWMTSLLLIAFDTLYRVCVWIGIWRAAKRYNGATVWALLSRLIVILVVLLNVFHVLTFWGFFSENIISTLDGINI